MEQEPLEGPLEPKMLFNIGEYGQVEAVRQNTKLFTHLGNLALYDHVWVRLEDDEENEQFRGAYIFRTADETFEAIEDYMIANLYPMDLNRLQVADCDIQAYERMLKQEASDVGDFIPDEWDGNAA